MRRGQWWGLLSEIENMLLGEVCILKAMDCFAPGGNKWSRPHGPQVPISSAPSPPHPHLVCSLLNHSQLLGPPHCSLSKSHIALPQDLCICSSLCLERFSLSYPRDSCITFLGPLITWHSLGEAISDLLFNTMTSPPNTAYHPLLWTQLCSPTSHMETLTPSTSECDRIWK